MLCSMALQSKLCAALHGQSNIGSMCDCKPCSSLDLSVLWKFYQELTVTIVQVPEERQCRLNVNIMSNRKKVTLTKDAPFSSQLADYVL